MVYTYPELNPNSFCAGNCFKSGVLDILYNHIFDRKANLKAIYEGMTKQINEDRNKYIKLFPLDADFLKNSLCKQNLLQSGVVYAGHDLPVWQNDPKKAKKRIMVISQDPRRSKDEMCQNSMKLSPVISISTPFGLHSKKWRNHKSKGLVHYLFDDLKKEYKNNPEELSIYCTDIYKLRGVEPASIDYSNEKVYHEILKSEIINFNPDVILLLGRAAHNAWNKINNDGPEPIVLCFPHPNARLESWRKTDPKVERPFSSDKKRKVILKKLVESLNF